MSITTDRIARKPNGIGGKTAPLDDHVKSYLFEALGSTLDSIVIGVIIVAEQGRILLPTKPRNVCLPRAHRSSHSAAASAPCRAS